MIDSQAEYSRFLTYSRNQARHILKIYYTLPLLYRQKKEVFKNILVVAWRIEIMIYQLKLMEKEQI